MRFSMILEMVDRLSAPARKARASVSSIGGSVRQMATQMRRAVTDVNNGTRSIEHFDRRARRLRQVALGRTFQAIGSSARGLGRDLDALVRRLRLVERGGQAAGKGLRKLGGMGLGMLKNGILAGGAAVAGAGGFALFDLFRTAGQFEQYQTMLEGTEGSVSAARKSMEWVTQFAKETPYELDQVMEAFVALKAYGIDPMDGSLRALGDAASGMSKPLSSAVEAIADAMTGEYERLKEFSIRAEKAGDRTTFSYVKNGKTITRVAKGQGEAIREALVAIFNERFGGGMERQAKTLFGIISNLKGMWTEFLLAVAKAGIFDFVKGKLQGLLDRVNEMAANGELQKWAQEISNRMIKAWEWGEKFVNETNWNNVTQDLKGIAEAAKATADGILALKGAVEWINSFRLPLFSAEGAIIDAVKNARGSLAPKSRGPAAGTPASRLPSSNDLVRKLTGKQASIDVGGKLQIDVNSAPGLAVRATPIASPKSMPMQVNTGRTMRTAA